MDDERDLPRIVMAAPLEQAEALLPALPGWIERGVDGILVTAGVVLPAAVIEPLRRIVAAAADLPVLVAGSPSIAGEVGAGLVLPEAGMAASEARRQLRSGALLGREASSVEAAALARGVDFLVCDLADFVGAESRIAETIEGAPVPILWRVGNEAEARHAIQSGGEGIVLGAADDRAATGATLDRLSALFPSRTVVERTVVVDGIAVPLEPDSAITDLLGDLGLAPASVRRNGALVPRRLWDDTVLVPGDALETSG